MSKRAFAVFVGIDAALVLLIACLAFGQTVTTEGSLNGAELRPGCVPEFCPGHPDGHQILVQPFTEDVLPQYTGTGALKIDRKSFDALMKDYPEAKLRVLMDDDCTVEMEESMKAIDKYIPVFVDPVDRRRSKEYGGEMILPYNPWGGGGFEYHDPRSIEDRLKEDRRRYEREQEELGKQIVNDQLERFAYQQWATVKRECWRQP